MTLFINELSFSNAKITESPDSMNIQRQAIYGSNYPDVHNIGVNQMSFRITLTINDADVHDTMARLRGSIKNKEFIIIRSTDQHLRDNKKTVFVKVRKIEPKRKPGTVYFTEINIDCDYIGTQGSHQVNYFINSTQVNNDFSFVGNTMVPMPVNSSAVTETTSGTIANHLIVRTPSWAAADTGSYTDNSISRGTVGFHMDPDRVFENTIRVYDGAYSNGKHITDTDYEFNWTDGKITVRQDEWYEIEFNKTGNYILIRNYDGTSFVSGVKLLPNSGQGFNKAYIITNVDHYVRIALDTEEEFEMFSCKAPSLVPNNQPIKIDQTNNNKTVSGGTTPYVQWGNSDEWMAGSRNYKIESSFIKNLNNAKDQQYWFMITSSGAVEQDTKDVFKRLE